MFSKQQVHVMLILWIEQMAVLAKYDDTPQGLRSRMIELERSGHVRRVDREGVIVGTVTAGGSPLPMTGAKPLVSCLAKQKQCDIIDISHIVGR